MSLQFTAAHSDWATPLVDMVVELQVVVERILTRWLRPQPGTWERSQASVSAA